MIIKPTEQECRGGVPSTAIETGWLCARYAHGKALPAWLYQTMARVRQQAGAGRLPILILPTGERQESLVVMTLREFLIWSQQRTVQSDLGGNREPCLHTKKLP